MKIHFYILIRSWNSFQYLTKCLDSVFAQEFDNYTILFVDDCSNYSKSQKKEILGRLKQHVCIFNTERKFAVRNAYELIHEFASENGVIINLDGDDWFANNRVLQTVENVYSLHPNCNLTYGNCLYFCPGQTNHLKLGSEVSPFINSEYSNEVIEQRTYRKEPFRPLHLRTWKVSDFKVIPKRSFLRPDKTWMKFCEDQAIFYPLLEMPNREHQIIREPLAVYNRETAFSDSKVHLSESLFDELLIRRARLSK